LEIPSLPHVQLVGAKLGDHVSLRLVGDFLRISDYCDNTILVDLANDEKIVHLNTPDTDGPQSERFGVGGLKLSNKRELYCASGTADNRTTYIWSVDSGKKKPFTINFAESYRNWEVLINRNVETQEVSRVNVNGVASWTHQITGTYKNLLNKTKKNKIGKVLGVHNNQLWLRDTSNRLYSLDLESGSVAHTPQDYGRADLYQLDEDGSRLFAFCTNVVQRIDIDGDQCVHTVFDKSNEFERLGFFAEPGVLGSPLPVIDDYIIFCDKVKAVIAVFNIRNGEIVWHYDLFDSREWSSIKEIRYYDNLLYVYCNDGTLHLFKLEA